MPLYQIGMEIRRLSYFVRIAEDGSLTKASGMLGIAQPALSRQVRLLEEELGVQLFSRSSRGMMLTEEGEYLRASVAGPLRELELALQNIRAFSAGIEGNFAIGMSPNMGRRLAGPLTIRMSEAFARIKLRVIEGPTGGLADWLHRGLIDLAILEDESRNERLFDREIATEPLVLAGPAGADLGPDRPVPFAEAARLPLIVPSHHLGIRNVINEASARARVAPNIRYEVDSWALAMELVGSGMGHAILPRLLFPKAGFAFSPIVEPALAFRLFVSVRRNPENGAAGRGTMIGYVTEAVSELVAGMTP